MLDNLSRIITKIFSLHSIDKKYRYDKIILVILKEVLVWKN